MYSPQVEQSWTSVLSAMSFTFFSNFLGLSLALGYLPGPDNVRVPACFHQMCDYVPAAGDDADGYSGQYL